MYNPKTLKQGAIVKIKIDDRKGKDDRLGKGIA